MTTPELVAIITSVAGIALALASLIWNMIQDLRNRGWLRLDYIPTVEKTDAGDEYLTEITLGLANTGTHPLTVTRINYTSRGAPRWHLLRWGELKQVELPVGRRIELHYRVDQLCPSKDLRNIYVYDHFGHRHRLKGIRKLVRHYPWPPSVDQS